MLRYGFKGAVYLKSKEGQVLYIGSEYHPEWTSGGLTVQDDTVTVNSLLGTQTYRLFDHITVSVWKKSIATDYHQFLNDTRQSRENIFCGMMNLFAGANFGSEVTRASF